LTKEKGKTIIFSTHDLNIALNHADKLWLMKEDGIAEGAPEDLVLGQTLKEIYRGEFLQFQPETGEFKPVKIFKHSVTLSGEGTPYTWTQKALERIGINTTMAKAEITVEIEDNMNKTRWILKNKGKKMVLNSIYELILQINQIINRL